MSMFARPLATAAVALLAAGAGLGGCASRPPEATVALHSRLPYAGAVDNLFVVVGVDSLPPEFAHALPAAFSEALSARGVRNVVRPISDLDLQPPTAREAGGFRYVMLCKPTSLERYGVAVNTVTLNCAAVDVRAHLAILKADVRITRGIGFRAFGDAEAQRAAGELVDRMSNARLLAAETPAAAALRPTYMTATVVSAPRTDARAPAMPLAPLPAAAATGSPAEPALRGDADAASGRVEELKVLPDGRVQEVRDGGGA